MYKLNSVYVFLIFIAIVLFPFKAQAFRKFYENGMDVILALENENVTMECTTDLPMKYCRFLHPSGKRYSAELRILRFLGLDKDETHLSFEKTEFPFTCLSTNAGSCSVTLKATMNYTGEWRCHIGQSVGVETMKIIDLRVVKEIAAVQTNVTAGHREPETLYCTTTRGFIPLSYCRFEPPTGLPFSIDSSVTQSKPLLNKYYFPVNKSLDRGDCAVTIRKITYEDVGKWVCGAGLDGGEEYIDIINVEVEGFHTMSTVIGVSFGTIAIICILSILGLVGWKKRAILGSAGIHMEADELGPVQISVRQQASSRQGTPEPTWNIPQIVVKSPSNKSEPGTSSPLMASIE